MKFKSFILIIFVFSAVVVNAQSSEVPAPTFVNSKDIPPGAMVSKGYTIGPGDEIIAKVVGEPDYDFITTVNDDGRIEVPFYDQSVVAKCRTEKELRADLSGLLAKYLRNPQLSLRIERKSRPPASIYGEVNKAMEITLLRKASLVEVLAIAGGVKDEAGGVIQIFRTRPPMCTADDDPGNWRAQSSDPTDVPSRVFSLASVRQGKEDSNPIIYPGDVIVVQRALPVYVTGEVVAPQGLYIKEGGMSLTEAIAKIGGPKPGAKTKDIRIYRLKNGSKEMSTESKDRELISANYDLIKKGQQKDLMLQPYDIIEVDKAKEPLGLTIARFALGAGKAIITAGANSVGYSVLN